jgi:hypothetical protein
MSNEMAPVDLPADGPLDAFLEAVSESLTDGYRELGGLVPLCFVVKADGESFVIGVPFTGHDSDDADEHIAAWVRQHFKEREVIRYAYAVEASYSSRGGTQSSCRSKPRTTAVPSAVFAKSSGRRTANPISDH